MGNKSFEGIGQELIRADKHFAEVRGILDTFNKGRCQLIPERDEDHNALVLRVRLEPKGSPALSAVIGEFLFTVRSVLDHVVYAIALRSGHPITDKHMFPISLNQSDFESAVKGHRLDGVSFEAQAIIRGLQPYDTCNEPLRWLDRLHNTDKHQTLHVAAIASSHIHFVWGVGGFQRLINAEELHDGAVIPVGVPLSDSLFASSVGRLCKVKVEAECALFLAFEDLARDPTDLEPFSVASVLDQILEFVRYDIVRKLYPFFD